MTTDMPLAVGVPVGFKDNLRRLRESKGWTQAQTATAVGVPVRSYSNWELGLREPRLEALVKLAAAFGVDYDELLEGVVESDPPRRKGKKK